MIVRTLSLIAALALMVLSAPTTVPAQTTPAPALRTLTFGTTSKSAVNWPEFVGMDLGFFAAQGLKLDLILGGASAQLAMQVTTGALDITDMASTSLVQAVQGGAPIAFILKHIEGAPFFVVGRKGMTSPAQLKGKTISVAGPSDITRFFVDKMISNAGLKSDDVTYQYAAASSDRMATLFSGGVDASIMVPPFSSRALDQGYSLVGDISKTFPGILFDGFVTRPQWAREHPDMVVAFLKGYLRSIRWLYDPANKARAIQVLTDDTGATPADAAGIYDAFVGKKIFSSTGIVNDGAISPVLDMLVKTGDLKAPLPPASKFYDNQWLRQASR
jgi:ABC-type nitrate/sulfonate/bicarbonate transport system substrate-binding protein